MLDHSCLARHQWPPVTLLWRTPARRHEHARRRCPPPTPKCMGIPQGDALLQPWAEQMSVCGLVAGYACWLWRPQGWADMDLIQVEESQVHGKGVFARASIAKGAVLGAYPGRLRTPTEMLSKVQRAPGTKAYVYRTSHGWYLDPTDAAGAVSRHPQPGLPWFGVDPTLAFVNEPTVADSVNVDILDEADMREVRFVAACDIAPLQELFIDYGRYYDRSSYS